MTWMMTAMVAGGATIGALTNKDDPGKGAMYGAAIGGTGGVLGGVGAGAGMFGGALNMAGGATTAGAAAATTPTAATALAPTATAAPLSVSNINAFVEANPTSAGIVGSGKGMATGAPTTLERGPLLNTGDTGITKFGNWAGRQKDAAGNFWDKHKGSVGKEVKGAAKQAAGAYIGEVAKPKPTSYPQAQPFRPSPYQQPQNPYERQAAMRKQPGFRGRR